MAKIQLDANDHIESRYFDTDVVGNVNGTTTSVDGNLVVFDGTTGKKLKSGGKIVTKTVSVAASTSGTATVTASSIVLGFNVTAITGTEQVKTVDISSTTLTVTLTGSDTATVKVTVLQP